jgi:Protein of unknown function (DUF3311)
MKADSPAPKNRMRALHLLLIVPFIGTLWVPFYNRLEPSLFGVPFFYWYQFLWIPIGAAITALLYFATRRPPVSAGATEKSAAKKS